MPDNTVPPAGTTTPRQAPRVFRIARGGPERRRLPPVLMAAVVVAATLATLLDLDRRPYDGYLASPGQPVLRVYPGGPAEAAGLRVGDRIQSIDGIPASDSRAMNRRPRPTIGEVRTLGVQRGEALQSVAIRYTGLPGREKAAFGLAALLALCFAGLGLWALLAAPRPSTRILTACSLAFGLAFAGTPYFASFALRTAAATLVTAVVVIGFAMLLHYLLVYPEPRGRGPSLPLVYGPAVGVALFFAWLNVAQPPATGGLVRLVPLVVGVFIVGYFLSSLVVLVRRYREASPEVRRENGLGLMLVGAAAALLPETVSALVMTVAPDILLPAGEYYFFALVFIPLTFAAAAVRGARARGAAA